MSRHSPNLDKLKALHHHKRDKGLAVAVTANETVEFIDVPLAPVEDTKCPKSATNPEQPGALLQKAEEFCRKTRVVANKCKVFVGNVGYRVKSRELKEFFSSFGKVIYAEIITDRKTKRSRG